MSGKPGRRGSMGAGFGSAKPAGPPRVMMSWFSGAETLKEEEDVPQQQRPLSPPPPPALAPPCVQVIVEEKFQITGLELLKRDSQKSRKEDADDDSYESYAQDSIRVAKVRKVLRPQPPPPLRHVRLTQSEHFTSTTTTRRNSLSAIIGSDEDTDSVPSMGAEDYYGYGLPAVAPSQQQQQQQQRTAVADYTPRRASVGTVGSYANDSVEFAKYKTTRRGSVGSYANDSVECKNMVRSRFASGGGALGAYSNHSRYSRRGSLGSQMTDASSKVYHRHSDVMRRSSLGSVSSGISQSVAASMSTGPSRAT
jgi:hypothetical protein